MWFHKSAYSGDILIEAQKPEEWIRPEDIDTVQISLWREHCLECAAPQCYHNCPNWIERFDKKCKKTHYGTHKNASHNERFCAQLKFNKWGKLETWVYPGAISFYTHSLYDRINYFMERVLFSISGALKYVSPKYRLCGGYVSFSEKILRKVGNFRQPDEFLIQCYSPAKREYNLLFEIYTSREVLYRNSVTVKRGYNQARFDVRHLNLRMDENPRMRIYPEDNIQEDIVFFCTDFITLKHLREKQSALPAEKVKCVAWDLDNTIWDKILIESDPDTLSLRPGILPALKELDKRGMIQIIVSKNDSSSVIPQLQRLGIDSLFVYVFANWNAKSENLKYAAKELNIHLDTFALIDDSHFERGEVKKACPCVRVYEETQVPALLQYPEFDVPITEETKRRRVMYQEERRRRVIRQNFTGTNLDFLKSCRLEMTIQRISAENLPRSFELLQRTNQLNLSGHKYTQEEFTKICEKDQKNIYVVNCRDRYGEYGQVGFFLVRGENGAAIVTEYAMSCRVAGKWLEPALLQWICAKYGAQKVIFKGVDSKKNGLLIRTLQSFGMVNLSAEEGGLYLSITAKDMTWPQVVIVNDRSEAN